MMVPVSLAKAKRERLKRVATASGARALALRSHLGRSWWMLLSIAALAGCHQQSTAGDPFLPFYRSRVPPPGTSVPPGGVPVDPYYGGTPGAAAGTRRNTRSAATSASTSNRLWMSKT